jgi:hypothetical protein
MGMCVVAAPSAIQVTDILAGLGKDGRMTLTRVAIALACLLGAYLRLWPVLTSAFPLNDGGLFYRMAQELIASGFSLPDYTSYNRADIPFAYPPLGLYLLAFTSTLTGLSLLDVQRVLPAILSIAAIPVFFSFARRLLNSPGLASVATIAFALLPRTWLWFIMGGGITRALGFLFVLLLFDRLLAAYTEHRPRDVVLAAICGAGAVSSHLENAWFGVYSAVLLFLAYGRTRRGIATTLVVGFGAAVLSSPWWISVLQRHGPAPFLHAARSGGQEEFSLDPLRYFTFSAEPFLPILGALGFIGVFVAAVTGRWFVPLWLIVIFFVNPRNPATPAAVPLALLVAITLCEVLVPAVNALVAAHIRPAVLLLAPLLGFVFLSSRSVAGNSTLLEPLSGSDRRAMRWISSHTPLSARLLVISGRWFGQDAAAEWLPALTGRVSAATVQGTEWLPGRRFYRGWKETDSLRTCQTARCVRRWINDRHPDVQYLYVRQGWIGRLLPELRDAADLRLRYARDSVFIFERRPGHETAAPAAERTGGRPTLSI